MIGYFTVGVIFMIVAILITFISSFYEKESTVERISVKIANVIQILFLVGLLISYKTYVNTSKQSVLSQQSNLAEKGWVEVYQKIAENYDKCPDFCNSLSYPWQVSSESSGKLSKKYKNTEGAKDDYGSVLSLSILIFESIQNVVNYFLYNESTEKLNAWISAFVIWANSDTLYSIWNTNKFIYDESIQKFGDMIFKGVREYESSSSSSRKRPQNPSDVLKLSSKICGSEGMKNIFKEVDKIPPCL